MKAGSPEAIGARLIEAMTASGMTNEELAMALGVRALNITRWRQGHNSPHVRYLPGIAEALNVTTDWPLGIDP